jgi:hypothetical protein
MKNLHIRQRYRACLSDDSRLDCSSMNDTEIKDMGADPKDYHRSSVAKRIFQLAKENELVFAHYEYRWPIPLPQSWVSERDQYAQGEVHWNQGVLSELKYQSFRHDSAVCNFHPGQSSKWGAHELCHKLVGFAFKPNADILFHALAAWAAEVLPVTVYYFWDEVDSFKCPKHRDFSFMAATFCKSCEEKAETQGHKREEYVDLGWKFLNAQLAAIEASIQKNKLLPAPYMALDLADDAYYYTLSQFPRLTSDTYQDFVKAAVPKQIYTESVEELILRIRNVAAAIMEQKKLASYGLSAKDWKVLDIGLRGLELSESIESNEGFLKITNEFLQHKNIDTYVAAYESFSEDYDLPSSEEFFGVGYVVNKEHGYYSSQIVEGIKTLLPETFDSLKDQELQAFLEKDRANRQFLGERLKPFLKSEATQVEVFLNQPQSFFTKDYSCRLASSKYKWSDRVRICKNSEELQELLGLDSPYFLLFKDSSGEVLSYPVEESVTTRANDSFKLEDLDLPLEESQFYVQNDILVETSED